MKTIPVEEAVGTMLAHAITRIDPGKFKGVAFRVATLKNRHPLSKKPDCRLGEPSASRRNVSFGQFRAYSVPLFSHQIGRSGPTGGYASDWTDIRQTKLVVHFSVPKYIVVFIAATFWLQRKYCLRIL